MKRIIFALLCVIMVLSLSACSEKKQANYEGSVSGSAYNFCAFITEEGKIEIFGVVKVDYKEEVQAIEDAVFINVPEFGENGTAIIKKDKSTFMFPKEDMYEGYKIPLDDLKLVYSTNYYTSAITNKGKVVTGIPDKDRKKEIEEEWEDIVKLAGAGDVLIGIKKDKTVLVSGDDNLKAELSEKKDIVDIIKTDGAWLVLKGDGSIEIIFLPNADENAKKNLKHLSKWKDMVQIGARGHLVGGLKSDGTVLIGGSALSSFKSNDNKDKIVQAWEGIDTIFVGGSYIIGVKEDGTVVAEGYSNGEQIAKQAKNLKVMKSS